MRSPLALFLVLLLAAPAGAQVVVSGTVVDAETGEPLPSATVQVEGTTTGTITNPAGEFEIAVSEPPGELLVRFIGYGSERTAVPRSPDRQRVRVALHPAAVVGPEVVVTADDPAENIMRRVIAEKARWQARLASWRAEAYSRQTLARDTGIVAIAEGATTAFWRRGDGVREVVRGARRTANIDFLDVEFVRAAENVINLYDDEVPFAGYRLMGPTSAGALRFYRFALDSIRTRDDRLIYDLRMEPRSSLQPGFEGRLSVQGEEWVIVDAALRPNAVVRLPGVPDVEFELAQQFIGLPAGDGAVWLPADYRFSGRITIGLPGLRFPEIQFRNVVRLTDFEVNVAVPDSLFEGARRAAVDREAVAADTALDREGLAVPLEPREAAAYARIDTTDTLAEAFQPTGPLARLVRIGTDRSDAGGARQPGALRVTPLARFNRVEAVHLGTRVRVQAPAGVSVEAAAGYATGLERATFDGRLSWASGRRGRAVFASGGYRREHAVAGAAAVYPQMLTSASTLLGGPDYYDYYQRQGGFVEAGFRLPFPRARLALGARAEDHRALPVTSGYDLLGRSGPPRPNPAATEGRLHAATLTAVWGDDPLALGTRLFPGPGAALMVEAAEPGILGGDFGYLRLEAAAHARLATGLRRRLFPMTLDLRLAAGTARGELPPQRAFSVEGTAMALAPAGSLRSLREVRASGARFAAATWEHDFRSVPFEIAGLTRLADLGFSLHLHGGHARLWEPPAGAVSLPGWRHEVGIGLSGGLTVPARLDLTVRLDAPGVFLSIGLPRLR